MNKALESEQFKHHLEALDRKYDIKQRHGFEVRKGWKEYEYVKLEVQFTAGWDAAMALAGLVYSWMTKRNPHYLDLAMTYCRQHEIPPTPTLWRLLGELAEMRINGDSLPGTPEKIIKEKAASAILILMANLIYHGDTLESAASKAAAEYKRRYPQLKPYKASSLERKYTDEWRNPGWERDHFATWDKHGLPDQWRDAWKQIRDALPEADPEMKGDRR
ncbi:MAG: hypothetical protein CL549_04355 [Alcanivorax sp.]|nr:hypothetical protein [Alcanivorax sp.]MAY09714.1 hypothetical protein [Alcanivorax sp.]MBI54138.1 hypothetical protein [Alcanivorax sp.]HCE38789.1 hypothetical protein [Alcanivorax sp.]|tara:strand:+ start:820 stop:1473 length:654 start_codon:yes stop_codon:yes gene_type:complete